MTAAMSPKTAYQGSANGARASMASRVSEYRDAKWASPERAKWMLPEYTTPEMAAKKAEMQKTMTRVVLVLRPRVASAIGLSDKPRSTRPKRPSWMATITRAVSTMMTRTT